jgi:hypothetical protein
LRLRRLAGGLDGGVERKQVGLEGDGVDHAGDLGDGARAGFDGLYASTASAERAAA